MYRLNKSNLLFNTKDYQIDSAKKGFVQLKSELKQLLKYKRSLELLKTPSRDLTQKLELRLMQIEVRLKEFVKPRSHLEKNATSNQQISLEKPRELDIYLLRKFIQRDLIIASNCESSIVERQQNGNIVYHQKNKFHVDRQEKNIAGAILRDKDLSSLETIKFGKDPHEYRFDKRYLI